MNATTGSRLREERVRLGFSQEKMSELGGVKRLSQTNYETDKRTPDGDYLIKIAEIGADVNYILTGVRMTVGKFAATLDDCTGSMVATHTPPTGSGSMLKGGVAANDGVSAEKMEWLRLLDLLDDDSKKVTFATTKTLAKNCEMAREFAQIKKLLNEQQSAA